MVAGAAVFIDVPIGVLRGALAAAVGGVGHLLHLPVDAILPLLSHPLPPELEFQPLFDFGGVVQRGIYVEADAVYSGPPGLTPRQAWARARHPGQPGWDVGVQDRTVAFVLLSSPALPPWLQLHSIPGLDRIADDLSIGGLPFWWARHRPVQAPPWWARQRVQAAVARSEQQAQASLLSRRQIQEQADAWLHHVERSGVLTARAVDGIESLVRRIESTTDATALSGLLADLNERLLPLVPESPPSPPGSGQQPLP